MYTLKILESDYVTHDVKRFSIEKPDGYKYSPSQGTDVAIDHPDWKNMFRPFTFTSLDDWPYLEFTIKIHDDHEGVTDQLGKTNEGAQLIIKEPYGTIAYKEPGIFIAGGSGITPFIAIFRDLYKKKAMDQNGLIYSNKTAEDIIYYDELAKMLNGRFANILTREQNVGFLERRIDRDYLVENIRDFGQHFYVCGPDDFVKSITDLLLDLGAPADTLVV